MVWKSLVSSFLKGIFFDEKSPTMIHQWFETSWFGILSFSSFLKGIFLAEKCPNI